MRDRWATDQALRILNMMFEMDEIGSAKRDMLVGVIAGALVEARRTGARIGDVPIADRFEEGQDTYRRLMGKERDE